MKYTEKDWITKRIWETRKLKGYDSLQFLMTFWLLPLAIVFDVYYELHRAWKETKK